MKKHFLLCLPVVMLIAFLPSCQGDTSKGNTNSKEAILAEAEKYKSEEDHDKACELYAQAYQLDKNDAYLNLRLGFCKLTANQKDSALIYYNASIGIKPSVDAYIQRASCYLLMGQYANVLSDADAALAMNPKSVKALTLKGAASFKAGNFNDAVLNFKKGLELNADSSLPVNERTNTIDLYRNIAKTYYDMKQLDSAELYCELWLEIDSNDFDAYQFLSIINEKNSKLEAAIINAERSIQLQPQQIEPYGQTAALYALAKKDDKACEIANKAKLNNVRGYEALVEAYCKPAK